MVRDSQFRQILLNAPRFLLAMPEASLHHGHVLGVSGRLLEIGHTQVTPIGDGAALGFLMSCQDVQQRSLASSVLRYQPHVLALGNAKADIVEERLVANGKSEVVNLQIRVHECHR